MTRARDLASGDNGIRPWASSAGAVSFSAPGTSPGAVSVSVVFTSGRFTAAPLVAIAQTGSINATPKRFGAIGASSTGFTATYYQDGGTAIGASISWIALQMTSGSGAG